MTTELIARLRMRLQTEPYFRDGIYREADIPTLEAQAADALEAQSKRIEELEESRKQAVGALLEVTQAEGVARANRLQNYLFNLMKQRAEKAEHSLKDCMAHADAAIKDINDALPVGCYSTAIDKYLQWRAGHK